MKIINKFIFAFFCLFLTTCQNPIMDKWWPEERPVTESGREPDVSGGSGDNFAMVVFNTDGGTPQPRAIKVAWGGVVGRLRPISRSNDGFLGWFDEKGNLWDVETRTVTQADDDDNDGFITLAIRWVEVADPIPIYTVKFETYPDSSVSPLPSNAVAISDQFVARDGFVVRPVEPPALPVPDNRAFAGWYTSVDYQSQWDFSFPVASNQPTNNVLTLYAKWDVDTHTIRFEANGGTRPDGVTILTHEFTISLSYGLVQDPGPLVRTGFSFAGWYMEDPTFTGSPWNFAKRITDSDVPSVVDGIPQENPLTLYAKWDRNIYNINFVIAPSADAAPPQQKVLHGLTVVKPADPQSGDGRGFAGWFAEETFINQWNFDNPVTSSMTLYAKYVVQTRTIHFQVNGGTTPGGMDFLPNRTIFVPNGKIINPGTLNREGFTFGGWFTDPECTITWNFDTPVTQPDNVAGEDPMYLYAKWTMNPHTVTFYIDGAQDATLTQFVIHGERAQKPVVSNPGHTLNGWYRNSNYTGAWDFDNNTITSNTSLYAKWDVAQYLVRFHLGTGVGDAANHIPQFGTPAGQPYHEEYYKSGDRIIEPYMPALPENDTTSWSFLGWYTYFNVSPSASEVATVTGNSATWRENNLHPYNFNTQVNDNFTYPESGVEVFNLYARWVPPVPDMVWVPRGTFTMGDSSVSGNPAAYHAYPTRRVRVDGFYISKYEVTEVNSPNNTIRSYAAVMGTNPSQFSRNTDRPVERVSWYDAIDYCMQLTTATGGLSQVYSMSGITRAPISGTGSPGIQSITNATVTQTLIGRTGYRLPTEAEWEYAARGGNGSPGDFTYSGSNNADTVAWYNLTVQAQVSGNQATQPAGSKQPNALGIYDMSGNVSEWCWDWFASYKDSYYSTSAAGSNPIGPPSGTERVRRGGGWSNAVGNVRSVVRNSNTPDSANWVVGFRVVRGPGTIW
ncbi:MAG: SUMF1/EgtB/PvdO family nonheme iron enzyme [Treponema sp.]|nr:SUMF1/EgtB/PvdO family nonheme iron enzyme [Treponema sp.]